ncbi:hypothetical protein IAU59_004152 [Kwoniella sp. CBS 9459]
MSCGNVQDVPEVDADGIQAEPEKVTMPRKKRVRRVDKSLCQRCQASKSMYIIRNVTYCKECFDSAFYARISKILNPALKGFNSFTTSRRSALLKGSRAPRQTGDAVIALSSGAGSTSMVEMLVSREFIGKGDGKIADLTKGEKEVVWDKGWVVYVEFAGVLDGLEDRSEVIKQWVDGLGPGVKYIGLRAEDVFDVGLKGRLQQLGGSHDGVVTGVDGAASTFALDVTDPNLPLFPIPESSSSSTTTPLEHLRALIASLPPASRPALLSSILNSLLTLTAQTLPNITHLLLGETSTRQASRLIAGTALGKGWSLPLELNTVHQVDERLMRLKPMKDITTKEAAIYCHLRGLSGWTRNERRWEAAGPKGKRDARGKGAVASLEQLTEHFIAGLSVTHPATVSTINRTGDKLVYPGLDKDKNKDQEEAPNCPVCQLPVDPSALEWKSRTALTSLPSKTVPSSGSTLTSISPSPNSSLTPEASANSDGSLLGPGPASASALAPLLCYGCLTTFTPPTVGSKLAKAEAAAAAKPVQLPIWISENIRVRTPTSGPAARKEVSRDEMRDTIGEYLINDDQEA